MIESTEQRQVLDMLAAGTIEAPDAERLLARLTEVTSENAKTRAGAPGVPAAPIAPGDLHLHVVARTKEGDDIDVRVPLKLVATGIQFEKLMPEVARDAIEETGVDLSELRQLKGDQLIEAIQDLEVDLEGHDGSQLSIRCD